MSRFIAASGTIKSRLSTHDVCCFWWDVRLIRRRYFQTAQLNCYPCFPASMDDSMDASARRTTVRRSPTGKHRRTSRLFKQKRCDLFLFLALRKREVFRKRRMNLRMFSAVGSRRSCAKSSALGNKIATANYSYFRAPFSYHADARPNRSLLVRMRLYRHGISKL